MSVYRFLRTALVTSTNSSIDQHLCLIKQTDNWSNFKKPLLLKTNFKIIFY